MLSGAEPGRGGLSGGAEVVNMRLSPNYLASKKGISWELACILVKWGRCIRGMLGGPPSILNASPEAATGGGLAHPEKQGTGCAIDLNKRSADILHSKEEYDKRRAALQGDGGGQSIRPPGRPGRNPSAASSTTCAHGMVLKRR